MNAVGGSALASNFNVQGVPSFLINKGSVEGSNTSDNHEQSNIYKASLAL